MELYPSALHMVWKNELPVQTMLLFENVVGSFLGANL